MKDIKEYEGLYSITENGEIWSHLTNKFLKSKKNDRGYLDIGLRGKSKRKWFRINRLVAETFLLNPDNKPQVNHIDGNKSNNHVSNLEWVTASENRKHAFETGLQSFKGENHTQNKLNEKQVRVIKHLLKSRKITHKDIAEVFEVTRQQIGRINTDKAWSHITI